MRWEIARWTVGVWATKSYSVFCVVFFLCMCQRSWLLFSGKHNSNTFRISLTLWPPSPFPRCCAVGLEDQSSFTRGTISCRRGLLCLIFSWLQCCNYGGINKLLIEAERNMLHTVVAGTRSWVRPLSLWDASVTELELCYAPIECSEGSVRLASLSLHKVLVKWTELGKGLEFSKLDFFRCFVRFTCESIIYIYFFLSQFSLIPFSNIYEGDIHLFADYW